MFPHLVHCFLLDADVYRVIALKLISLKYVTASVFSHMLGVHPKGAVDMLGENHMAKFVLWVLGKQKGL